MSENDKSHDHMETFFTEKDESLSDGELRERWKFMLPSTNFYLMAAMGFLFGIVFWLRGDSNGPKLLIGSLALLVAVTVWQQLLAMTKSREQMIDDIKRLREIHADSDM